MDGRGDVRGTKPREAVCRVMDGGREALERRNRRSGPESTHVR